jgi:hypothetical protein
MAQEIVELTGLTPITMVTVSQHHICPSTNHSPPTNTNHYPSEDENHHHIIGTTTTTTTTTTDLSQIEATYKTEIINIAEYLNKKYKEDQFLNIIRSHKSSQPTMNSTVRAAAKIIDELSQPNENNDMKQDGTQNPKARLEESLKKKWENKVMHCQCIRSIDKQLVSEEDTFLWLLKRDLKAETESKIVAAQYQALQTKYYATKI